MALSKIGDSHCERRFHIECPVTVAIQARGKSSESQGTLQEIWVGGARFYLDQPLAVGTRLILYVHFPDPTKSVTTVRFEGIVMRAWYEVQHEMVIEFRGGGKFLPNRLRTLADNGQAGRSQTGSRRI